MKAKVLSLSPTQMALGMREVDYRIEKLHKMKEKEREEYLHERKVPIVLGPNGRKCLIDHHHLVRSAWEAQIDEVPVEVVADLSDLDPSKFWARLNKENWIYTFDQLGNGPHDPLLLPQDIRGLADDPFRSLSWMAREAGAYEKCKAPFSEFLWANFFRIKFKSHLPEHDYKSALERAIEIAHSSEAQHLPGHISRIK